MVYSGSLCLLLCQRWRSNMISRSVTHDHSNRRQANMVGMGKGDPLEVINFWWCSDSGQEFRINFSFPHRNRDFRRCISITHTVIGQSLRDLVK